MSTGCKCLTWDVVWSLQKGLKGRVLWKFEKKDKYGDRC